MHNGSAKLQHYVPQFLLRNFGAGKKHKVHVFDKQTDRTFATNIRNVAAESHFYDFEFEGQTLTLEPSLSKLESRAKPLFARVLAVDGLSTLGAEDRAVLCDFFSVQFTRTRWFREHWRSMTVMLGEKLRQMARSQEELSGIEDYIGVPDDKEARIEMVRFMAKAPKDFAVHFANKSWVLIKTEQKRPFLIGDNPLALQNVIDMKPYGNIGLAVRGIEIYFPLSPTRALALWCPSHEEMFRKGAADVRLMSQIAPHIVATHICDPLMIEQTVAAIDTGRPLEYRTDNVINFNSLQIRSAERYVFSSIEDFALAREMITAHPDLRSGPRMRMN